MAVKKKVIKEEEIKSEKNSKFSFKIPNIKKLIFKPNQFINSIEKESEYQPILTSYLFLYVIYFILSVILGLTVTAFDLKSTLLGFTSVVIFSIIAPFFIAGIIHIFVLILKGKQGFFNTFKPVVYGLMIMLMYSFLVLILTTLVHFAMPYDLTVLQNMQNSTDSEAQLVAYQEFISQPGAIAVIAISGIFVLISIIHMFIFSIKGLIKFQKLSKVKASMAIIIGYIVLFLLLVILSLFSILSTGSI